MFIVLIVGLIFFLFGSYFLYEAIRFRNSSHVIKGTVVGYEKEVRRSSGSSSGGVYYYLVVEYFLTQRYRLKGDIGSSSMSYNIGEEVDVMLTNMDPHTARIKRPARLMMGFIFAFLGFIALIIFFVNVKGMNLSWNISFPFFMFIFALGYLYYKLKKKMANLGVSRISDLLSKSKKQEKDPLSKGKDGVYGYQPSSDFISSQHQIKQVPAYVHYIFLILGVVLLVFGLQELQKRQTYLDDAPSVFGQIVGSQKSFSSDGDSTYYPLVKYTVNEQTYEFKHNLGTNTPSWNVGDTVKVYYSKSNPKNALMDEGWMNYLWQGIATFMGLLLTLNGIKQSFFPKKRTKL